MTTFHVDLEEQQIVIGARLTQFGNPFGRLPIGDARIRQTTDSQDRRIGLRTDPDRKGCRTQSPYNLLLTRLDCPILAIPVV